MSAISVLPSRQPCTADSTIMEPPSKNSTSDESEKEQCQIVPELVLPPLETRALQGWKWALFCFGLYFSNFLYGLDNTVAADIQSAIVNTYGDVSQLAWVGTGFPLGSVATILTFGKAYETFNPKWIHVGSVTVFSIGSAVCGAAPNMNALITGRVIAGAGGAGMYIGLLNLIAVNTTSRERPAYMGGTGVIWGAGTILGPVVGGAFADSGATWRWAFYLNLVVFGVLSPAFWFIPSSQPEPGTPTLTKLKQLDWVGTLLIAGLYASFVVALTFGGATWAWNSGRTIVSLTVCVAILIIYIIQQYFAIFTTPEHRLFPTDFIASRTMVILYITTPCASTTMFVTIYYVPLMFQFSRGDSGLESAVRLLPFIVVLSLFIMGSGAILPRVRYYITFFIAGGVFILMGGALMFTVKATTSTSSIYGYSVLLSIGAGLTAQIGYSVASAKVQSHKVSAAIGFINIAQIGGLVIALAVSGTVFQNVAFHDLSKILYPLGFTADDVHGAIAGSQSTLFGRLPNDVKSEATEVIVSAIGKVYTLIITAGALCLVASIFLRREKLFTDLSAGGA